MKYCKNHALGSYDEDQIKSYIIPHFSEGEMKYN